MTVYVDLRGCPEARQLKPACVGLRQHRRGSCNRRQGRLPTAALNQAELSAARSWQCSNAAARGAPRKTLGAIWENLSTRHWAVIRQRRPAPAATAPHPLLRLRHPAAPAPAATAPAPAATAPAPAATLRHPLLRLRHPLLRLRHPMRLRHPLLLRHPLPASAPAPAQAGAGSAGTDGRRRRSRARRPLQSRAQGSYQTTLQGCTAFHGEFHNWAAQRKAAASVSKTQKTTGWSTRCSTPFLARKPAKAMPPSPTLVGQRKCPDELSATRKVIVDCCM